MVRWERGERIAVRQEVLEGDRARDAPNRARMPLDRGGPDAVGAVEEAHRGEELRREILERVVARGADLLVAGNGALEIGLHAEATLPRVGGVRAGEAVLHHAALTEQVQRVGHPTRAFPVGDCRPLGRWGDSWGPNLDDGQMNLGRWACERRARARRSGGEPERRRIGACGAVSREARRALQSGVEAELQLTRR